MTFYDRSNIAYWQGIERENLRLAYENSGKRTKLNALDRHRIKPCRRDDLLAVNSYSRMVRGSALCEQLAHFFCDGGDGQNHKGEILFVTLCDKECLRSPNDGLSDEDLSRIKNRLTYGLRGLNYIAVIDPALYVNFQEGFRTGGNRRCISWHMHALVWEISKEALRKRLRKARKSGWYVKLGRGLRPIHVKPIKQGRLPRAVGYLVKSPISAYRASLVDWMRKGRPVTDADGVVLQKYKQGKSRLRPGERLTLYFIMRHLCLEQLATAGGAGRLILEGAKRLTRPRRTTRPRSGRGRKRRN